MAGVEQQTASGVEKQRSGDFLLFRKVAFGIFFDMIDPTGRDG